MGYFQKEICKTLPVITNRSSISLNGTFLERNLQDSDIVITNRPSIALNGTFLERDFQDSYQ